MRNFKTIVGIVLFALLVPAGAQSQSTELTKQSVSLRNTFKPVIRQAVTATVVVMSNGNHLSLGTIVSADGFILTKASELKGDLVCRLHDGRELPAGVKGVIESLDLAMLKVDAENLPAAQWKDAGNLEAGTWVASTGLLDRPLSIGMTSLPGTRKIASRTAMLGVLLEQAEGGARIVQVLAEGGAQRAGLTRDDIIRAINGQPTPKREDVSELIADQTPGTVVRVSILRGEEEKEFEVTLVPQRGDARRARGDRMNQMGGRISERRTGFPAVIQHDSVLAPNHCGGPLVTLDGKLIGINIARFGRVESYALPSEIIREHLEDLKSGKHAPTTQP